MRFDNFFREKKNITVDLKMKMFKRPCSSAIH